MNNEPISKIPIDELEPISKIPIDEQMPISKIPVEEKIGTYQNPGIDLLTGEKVPQNIEEPKYNLQVENQDSFIKKDIEKMSAENWRNKSISPSGNKYPEAKSLPGIDDLVRGAANLSKQTADYWGNQYERTPWTDPLGKIITSTIGSATKIADLVREFTVGDTGEDVQKNILLLQSLGKPVLKAAEMGAKEIGRRLLSKTLSPEKKIALEKEQKMLQDSAEFIRNTTRFRDQSKRQPTVYKIEGETPVNIDIQKQKDLESIDKWIKAGQPKRPKTNRDLVPELENEWNILREETKTPIIEQPIKTEPLPIIQETIKPESGLTRKPSGIAKQIEAKAKEKGIIGKEGYDNLATYKSSTLEEQKNIASKYSQEQINNIATNKVELPIDMKPGTALGAAEDYAMKTMDGKLVKELIESPLNTRLSEAASEISLSRIRDKHSAIALGKEIINRREKIAEKKMGNISPEKVKTNIKKSLDDVVNKALKESDKKYTWSNFFDDIVKEKNIDQEPYMNKMQEAIKRGEFDPRFFNGTSRARRDILAGIVGEEDAQKINKLYEQKSLLVNQEKAMLDWAKDITGISKKDKEEMALKIKQRMIERKQKVYDPKENEKFLNELTSEAYSKKFKTGISLEEAQTITELSQGARKTEELLKSKIGQGIKQIGDNPEQVALDKYIGELKLNDDKGINVNPFKAQGVGEKYDAVLNFLKYSIKEIANNSKSIKGTFDNSLWGRQGIRVLKDPRFTKIWAKDFMKSWSDIGKTLKGGNKAGDALVDAEKALTYGHENYLNGRFTGRVTEGKAGTPLDIGVGEEVYPSGAITKIPILGRAFKASQVAYEVGAVRLRKDIATKIYEMAEKNGADLTNNKIVGDLNEVVNIMTGRGKFNEKYKGSLETVNAAFFSPRLLKSHVDAILTPFKSGERISAPARKVAATNLLYNIANTGVLLKIAYELNPEDNKDIFNPKSSNFGKIKTGNVTVDLTGGMGGVVTMMAKIIAQQATSANTGITRSLGSYGAQSGMDVFWDFTEGKFSPLLAATRNIVEQKTREGKPPTVMSVLSDIAVPIPITNIGSFGKEQAAHALFGAINDALGFSANVVKPENELVETIKSGKAITPELMDENSVNKIKQTINNIYKSDLQKGFDKVDYKDALYNMKNATPKERQLMYPAMANKIRNEAKNDPIEFKKRMKELNDVMKRK